MKPTFKDIEEVGKRLEGVINPSPLVHSSYFSKHTGHDIYLKLENLQETGPFKVRGAYNRLVQLDEVDKKRGVIAAVNRARALAKETGKILIPAFDDEHIIAEG